MTGTRTIAVLTGDLVNSTELGHEKIERAFGALVSIAAILEDWHGAPVYITRHRGDGWQASLAHPKMALRSALAIRAALRKEGAEFDSYIGIAIGDVTGDLGPDLNAEASEVFMTSGHMLDVAKQMEGIRFAHGSGGEVDAATILADHISQGWTPAQAAAILPFLVPTTAPSFTSVAKTLSKSRQAVTKSAEAAGLLPIGLALDCIEGSSRA